jgi:hypothetical protein
MKRTHSRVGTRLDVARTAEWTKVRLVGAECRRELEYAGHDPIELAIPETACQQAIFCFWPVVDVTDPMKVFLPEMCVVSRYCGREDASLMEKQ